METTKEANTTFTGNDGTALKPLSIEEINEEVDRFDKMIVDSFTSVKVRVDPELKGNQYYLVVSQEMFEKIQENKK